MKIRTLGVALAVVLAGPLTVAAGTPALPPLQVTPDGRSFTAGGEPFLWLADSAAGLLSADDPAEVAHYLDVRAAQGFTVVRAPAPEGVDWTRVDAAVDGAAQRGLRLAITPASPRPGLGEFLGARYGDRVVWVLGDGTGHDGGPWSAVASGIAAAAGDDPLMTFTPAPGRASGDTVGDAPWLSFALVRSGLCQGLLTRVVDAHRPFLDARPAHEDGCAGPTDALGVRRAAYADVFSGAAGHTYGHPGAWAEDADVRAAALRDEGAAQLVHLRALTDSRSARTPAPELLTEGDAGVLRGPDHLLAHAPAADGFALDTTALSGDELRAWWFDPRTGEPVDAGTVPRSPSTAFFPPVTGPADADQDWVLVVDAVDGAAVPLAPPGSP